MLVQGQGASSDGLATILDEEDLHNDRGDDDADEEEVVKETSEHVELHLP